MFNWGSQLMLEGRFFEGSEQVSRRVELLDQTKHEEELIPLFIYAALVEATADFAFESTLSGLRYAKRMQSWKAQGYSIDIVYLRLPSPQLARTRVAARVKQGGHNVARTDVLRRYKRSWANFLEVYLPLADHWAIYENSESPPKLLERGP